MSFNSKEFRKHFPQLEREVENHSLVYFDNGASTLKHLDVIDRVSTYNKLEVANVHRGAHSLSQWGTEAYEKARESLQKFVGAKDSREIVFTRGTTESINLVANIVAEAMLQKGDEILISPFEHHSNIVPWQMICEKYGCQLKVIAFDPKEGVRINDVVAAMTEKTKLCSFLWYSNSFGNRLPVEDIIKECKKRNIITLVDAAQTALTEKINVDQLGCDFLALSGHKMFAPYGIGALYGRLELLDKLPPYQGGGSMIDRVSFEKTSYAQTPQKYEAGTPNVAGAIGLGLACDVIASMNFADQHKHILSLRKVLKEGLSEISSCEIYDFESSDYSGVLSFNIKGAHPSDIGTLLDKYGVAVRAGHHCTQPLMELLGIEGTVRVSLAAYNTENEVKYFIDTMKKVEGFF